MTSPFLRNFTHITIPAEIWLLKGLSMQGKALWAELRSLHDKEQGGCYASDDYLMEFMGLKRRRLQEVMKELKDKNLMKVVSFDGRRIVRCALVPEPDYGGELHSSKAQEMHGSCAEYCTPQVRNTAHLPLKDTYTEKKAYKKEKKSPKSKSKKDVTAIAMTLSSYLFEKIKEWKLDFKKPNFKKWAEHVDNMMRIDGRSEENIRKVIDWCQSEGCWWRSKVLSTEKLRGKFDQLEALIIDQPKAKSNLEPHQQCGQYWINGSDYNGATCNLNEEGISFYRGMTHRQVTFKFGGWKANIPSMLKQFGIECPEEFQSKGV